MDRLPINGKYSGTPRNLPLPQGLSEYLSTCLGAYPGEPGTRLAATLAPPSYPPTHLSTYLSRAYLPSLLIYTILTTLLPNNSWCRCRIHPVLSIINIAVASPN